MSYYKFTVREKTFYSATTVRRGRELSTSFASALLSATV